MYKVWEKCIHGEATHSSVGGILMAQGCNVFALRAQDISSELPCLPERSRNIGQYYLVTDLLHHDHTVYRDRFLFTNICFVLLPEKLGINW